MNVRIFFSSPGDVKMERETAKRIVDRLQSEIGGRVAIQPYFWEHEVMVATKDYQQNIPSMDDFDIVVCILWSRLGTPLDPERHPKPGGGGFASGTEYEFVTAMKAHELKGTPDIFVFRNTTEPRRPSRPKEVREAVDREIDRLDTFFETYFEDDSFFTRAINIYDTLGEFEEKLTIALRSYIIGRVPSGPPSPNQAPRRSYDRQPYLGLASFDYADAPVFFGRTAQVGEIIAGFQAQELEALSNPEQPPRHFTLILGSSGSGKSSLARAGVLPMLTNPGVIEGATSWRTAMFKPADVPGDPILALVRSLDSPMGLPELFADGTTPREIADLIRSQPQGGGLLLRQALTQAGALALTQRRHKLEEKLEELVAGHREEDAKLLREKIEELTPPAVRIALLADQMEELFTSDLSPESLNAFIAILVALANSGRVFVLATLRSDFYARCLEHPELIALMQGNGSYALPAPSAADIGQMIRQPASIAGLVFEEKTTSGEKLDELLRDAALKDPTALPLLSYTLEQLYEQRTPEGMMTLEAYYSLGGLEGAIGSRAETVFTSLPGEAQAAFDPLCKQLVTLREGGEPTRRRAFYSTLTRSPEAKTLVDALVASRLLTADQSPDGERVIAVAHEALLRHWPRLVAWVADNKLFLDTRSRLTSRLNDWLDHGKSDEYLIPRGPNLSAAESIATAHLASLDPVEIEFIGKSADKVRKADQRKLRNARLITVGAVVLCLMAIAGGFVALGAKRQAQTNEKLANTAASEAQRAKDRATAGEARSSYLLGIQYLENGKVREGLNALAQTLAIDPDHQGAIERLYSQHLYGLPKAIPIRSVAYNAEGTFSRQRISGAVTGPKQRVAYLHDEKGVEVFDLVTRKTVPGDWEKDGKLFATVISNDSKVLWCIREDMSLCLWNIATGKRSKVIETSTSYNQLATSSDGTLFFEALQSGKITVYSTEDGSVVDSWQQAGDVLYIAESFDAAHMVSVSDKEIIIYDIAEKSHSKPVLPEENYQFTQAIVSTDSSVFATVQTFRDNPWNNNKLVTIHSTETGELVPLETPISHSEWITTLRFDSGAERIVLALDSGKVQPYAIPSGEAQESFFLPSPPSWLAISPDNRLLVTGTMDNIVRIYDFESHQLAFDPIGHDGTLEDLGISWDGRYVLASTKSHARVWDLAASPALNLPAALPVLPDANAIHLETDTLVTFDAGGFRKYDLKTMKQIGNAIPAAEDGDGRLVSSDGTTFAEYRKRGEVAFYRLENDFAEPVVWDSGDGTANWALSEDGSLLAWQIEKEVTAIDTRTGKPLGEPFTLAHDPIAPINMQTSGGARFISVLTGPDQYREKGNAIELLDASNHTSRIIRLPKMHFEQVLFSSNRRYMLVSGRTIGQAIDCKCFLWDLENLDATPLILPSDTPIAEIFFSQDSQLAGIRTIAQAIQVWDLASGQPLGKPVLIENSVPFHCLFSPDGSRIGVLTRKGDDSLLRVWDWKEAVPVTRLFKAPRWALRMFFNSDGSKISTIWADPTDQENERRFFGQWEVRPAPSILPVISPLTKLATATNVHADGSRSIYDPYTAWNEIRETDPDSWFLKSPVARTISPASEATSTEWLNFPYLTFDDMNTAMPGVGLVHASIAMWLQTGLNNRHAQLKDFEEDSEDYKERAETIQKTEKRIARLVELAERNSYDDPDTLHALARQAIRAGDSDRGISFAEKALEANPRHPDSLRLLVETYQSAKDPEAALPYLKTLSKLDSPEAADLAALAINLWNRGDTKEAEPLFPRILESEDLNENTRAHILLISGNPAGALKSFQKAAEVQKQTSSDKAYNLDSHIFLVTGLFHTGKFDEAVEHYVQAIEIEPLAAIEKNLEFITFGEEYRDALRKTLRLTLEKHPELAPK